MGLLLSLVARQPSRVSGYDFKFVSFEEEFRVTRTLSVVGNSLVLTFLGLSLAQAQRGGGDWMTSGFDAQRSSWVRGDGKISPASMSKPGFEMDWSFSFDNTPRQLISTTPPALLDFYIGYRGFRALGFVGASSDRIITLDVDLGRVEWQKALPAETSPQGTLPCPGGMTSAVTRPTSFDYPAAFFGRGAGRSTPAKSGVGEPYEGAVTLKTPPPPRPAPAPKPSAAAPASNPFAPRIQWILGLTGDGKLHSLYVSNGDQPDAPIQFLPRGAKAHGLIAVDNFVYAATSNGCGDTENGVWVLDLESKKVRNWKAPAGQGIVGTAGPAARPDGTFFATASNGQLVALAPRTLDVRASYRTGGPEFTTSPLVFEFDGKDYVAAATNDGRLHVFDTNDLAKGPLATSAVYSAPDYQAGALASWQDPAGVRWILAPAAGNIATASTGFRSSQGEIRNGAVVAWKLTRKNGALTFEPGWVSRDLIAPHSPIIVNGVVFLLSSGEFRSNDPQLSAAERARRSSPAVVYAVDGLTGKELWNSGTNLKSFVHSGGLAAGGGRIYVATHDGVQYAFGFPFER